jgi:hypothetical protein
MKRRCLKVSLSIGASLGLITLAICVLQPAPADEDVRGGAPDHRHHERDENSAAAAFDGKIVALAIRGASSRKLLAEARFDEVGGRTFLVGREVRSISNIPATVDAHLAWDTVDAFYVFESVEQYEAARNSAMGEVRGAVSRMTDAVQSVQVRVVDPANRLNGHGGRLAAAHRRDDAVESLYFQR